MSPSGRRIETFIAPMPGCRSAHVAMKLAELADVRGQLEAATRSLNPEQLAWRPSPDSNSIAMLLTHVALVEVHMSQVGLKGEPHNHVHHVLPITFDDDGIPIEKYGGQTPAAIAGKPIGFFAELLERAFAHTREACAELDDATLAEEIPRPPRPDGSYRVFDRRWVLHHLVDHLAQHMGQVQVLKRQWLAAHPEAVA